MFLIRLHKNRITQTPGWNREVLKWCLEEAREKKLTKADYCGGLVIDEMKIQVSWTFIFKNNILISVLFFSVFLKSEVGNGSKKVERIVKLIIINPRSLRGLPLTTPNLLYLRVENKFSWRAPPSTFMGIPPPFPGTCWN